MSPREVPPGWLVDLRNREKRRQKLMYASQDLMPAVDPRPFDPVLDGGHL